MDFVIVMHGNASTGDVTTVLREGLLESDMFTIDEQSITVAAGFKIIYSFTNALHSTSND